MITEFDIKSVVKQAGGPTTLGKLLGIGANAVSNWPHVPAKHLHRVAAIIDVPPEKLRSDLFPANGVK